MTKARLDGLYLMLLGSAIFLFLGVALTVVNMSAMNDFKGSYYGVRTVLQGGDPYSQSDVLRVYSPAREPQMQDWHYRTLVTLNVYPPTEFTFVLPFALLPFGPAHLLWVAVTVACFLLASFLIWDYSSRYDPLLSGLLISCVIANSELLIFTGNAAGIAISLCMIAVWCFCTDRWVLAGVVCMAISLALKPQDAGPVWLFLILIGGVQRKRSLQALAVLVAFSIPMLVIMSRISPHWIHEMISNIQAYFAHGAIDDPGPASSGAHGMDMMTNLQTAVSVFWDNPHFYNLVTYLVCIPLLLIWMRKTLESLFTAANAWLALAAILPLAMVGVYHRQYDTKLLILAVPVVAMLSVRGARFARRAFWVLLAGILLTGDLTWAFLIPLINHLHGNSKVLPDWPYAAIRGMPVPLTLLAMGTYFLWLYVRHPFEEAG